MAPWESDIVATLHSLPGLQVTVGEKSARTGVSSDFTLTISSPSGVSAYHALPRNAPTASTAATIAAHFRNRGKQMRPLLLAPYVSPAASKVLVDAGIEYVDAAGNMWLRGAAIYAVVEGKKRREQRTSKLTESDLRVTYSLLTEPTLIEEPVRKVAQCVGVSKSAVGNTFQRLEQLGYLLRGRDGYRFREYLRLLERWELGYAEQLKARLNPMGWRTLGETNLHDLALAASEMPGVTIGGEIGADLVLPRTFTPTTLSLHLVDVQPREVASRLGLARSGRGEAQVTTQSDLANHRSATMVDGIRLADPVLIRAELLQIGDPRLDEVAERLLNDKILPRHHGGR
jgi:hypothetical protein